MRARAMTHILSVCAIGVAWFAVYHYRSRHSVATEETAHADRVARVKIAAPDLSRGAIEAKIEESDAIRRVHADVDIDERMKAVQLTDAELRAFHARNYEIFQGRSFEESIVSVDVLARLERVRAELGLPPSSRIR